MVFDPDNPCAHCPVCCPGCMRTRLRECSKSLSRAVDRAEREAEARIVAWLRSDAPSDYEHWAGDDAGWVLSAESLCNAIERGDHRKGGE